MRGRFFQIDFGTVSLRVWQIGVCHPKGCACRILSRPRVGLATKQVVSGISEGAEGGFRVLKFSSFGVLLTRLWEIQSMFLHTGSGLVSFHVWQIGVCHPNGCAIVEDVVLVC